MGTNIIDQLPSSFDLSPLPDDVVLDLAIWIENQVKAAHRAGLAAAAEDLSTLTEIHRRFYGNHAFSSFYRLAAQLGFPKPLTKVGNMLLFSVTEVKEYFGTRYPVSEQE